MIDKDRDTSPHALELLRRHMANEAAGAGGRLLPERQLAEHLGIGRRALRRALEVLETEGAISRRQGVGTFIGPGPRVRTLRGIAANTDFLEIMEVRLRLEPQLAQLAALRARSEDIAQLREFTERIRECDDADARELWDGAFHRAVAKSAGNALFLTIFDLVNRVRQDPAWQRIRARARAGSDGLEAIHAHHDAIVEAIAARDPAGAAEAMRRHLLLLQERLIRQTSVDLGLIGTDDAAAQDQFADQT